VCVVCDLYHVDWRFKNGKFTKLVKVNLFRVFSKKVANLDLCRLHDLEIFKIGEVRFLANYMKLVEDIEKNRTKYDGYSPLDSVS